MRFPSGLVALNHGDFRRFFFGQAVSLIGTWMQAIGQSWLILSLTTSPFRLGLISTLQFLPVLLFSLAGGALVDRLPKRRVIIVTQIAFMLQAFVMAVLVYTGTVQYWHVAVLATVFGLVNALDLPARQSYYVEMVGKGDLSNAISLNAAAFNAARVVGPGVAGLVIAHFGIALAFLFNGLSFLAVLIALFWIKAEGLPVERHAAPMYQEIREGLSYAWRSPLVSLLLGQLLFVALFVINFQVLVPLLAKDVLQQGAGGFGLLMSVYGLGALLGALAMAVYTRGGPPPPAPRGTPRGGRPPLALLVSAGVVLCLASMAMRAAGTSIGLAGLLLFIAGVAQINFSAATNVSLQTLVPDGLRGRVMSLYVTVFNGSMPLGSFFIGSVAEGFGALNAFLVGGVLGLISMVVIHTWRRGHGGSPVDPQLRTGD